MKAAKMAAIDGKWASLESEIVVVCAGMCSPEWFDQAAALQPDDFYREQHRQIWRLMQELHAAGKPLDPVTIFQAMRDRSIESADSVDLLKIISVEGWSPVCLPGHIETVQAMSLKRRTYRAMFDATNAIEAVPPLEVAAHVAELERQIRMISGDVAQATACDGRQGSKDALAFLEGIARGGNSGIRTGIANVDQVLGSIARGKLCLIGGRPSNGKSALALGIALNACKAGLRCYVATLEDDRPRWFCRAMAHMSRVSLSRMLASQIGDEDYSALFLAADDLCRYRLIVDDQTGLTVAALRSKVRRLSRDEPFDLVIVDFAQLLRPRPEAKRRGKEEEVREIVLDLQDMPKGEPYALIVASQLSRKSTERAGKMPELSDFRDSGGWEEAAYQALLVHQPHLFDESKRKDEAMIIVAKNKDGPIGQCTVGWDGPSVRFYGV